MVYLLLDIRVKNENFEFKLFVRIIYVKKISNLLIVKHTEFLTRTENEF